MATLLGERNKSLGASYTIDTKIAGLGIRKRWSVAYMVLATTGEDEDDVVGCGGLPILGEIYRNGFCLSKSPQELTMVQGGALWEVTCEFDSHVDTDIPVVDVSWDIDERDEVIKYDAVTGFPILNSAQEQIITTSPITVPILNLTRIEGSFSASTILSFNNHVNNFTFFGAPPMCALMKGPSARKKTVNGLRMWEVRYRIKFNMKINPKTLQPQGWYLFLLDHGTRYVEADSNGDPQYRPFTTDVDKDSTTGNLDGHGKPLTKGFPEVYLGYNRYALANFNSLNLEQ